MREFAIYYPNGQPYRGETQKEWDAAPLLNVQLVEELRPDKTKIVHMGQHHYMRKDGQVFSCQETQLWKYLLEYCPWLKHARWITDEDYALVRDRAFPGGGT